ncbi:hypothetical protein N9L68_02745 [bacterium]|nr:hypothetical protein [bacterium]
MATNMATRLRRTYNGSDDAATMLIGSFPTPEDKIVLQHNKWCCHHTHTHTHNGYAPSTPRRSRLKLLEKERCPTCRRLISRCVLEVCG